MRSIARSAAAALLLLVPAIGTGCLTRLTCRGSSKVWSDGEPPPVYGVLACRVTCDSRGAAHVFARVELRDGTVWDYVDGKSGQRPVTRDVPPLPTGGAPCILILGSADGVLDRMRLEVGAERVLGQAERLAPVLPAAAAVIIQRDQSDGSVDLRVRVPARGAAGVSDSGSMVAAAARAPPIRIARPPGETYFLWTWRHRLGAVGLFVLLGPVSLAYDLAALPVTVPMWLFSDLDPFDPDTLAAGFRTRF